MKKTALILLITLGLSPVLFSSYASVQGTAGNRTGSSHLKATRNHSGEHYWLKATAGSNGVQWNGGNNVQ
jgi:hypothetical protein